MRSIWPWFLPLWLSISELSLAFWGVFKSACFARRSCSFVSLRPFGLSAGGPVLVYSCESQVYMKMLLWAHGRVDSDGNYLLPTCCCGQDHMLPMC